jgi:dCMP deaminase
MSWDERFMAIAELAASWSKDRSRKTGAVIVDHRNVVVAIGWNGFPRGVNDNIECRHERPAKYQWTEHAERNAIYNAAAKGVPTDGCRMYLPWYPCADCARAIIQAGIGQIICVEPDWNDPKWGADFAVVREMLAEACVSSTFMSNRTPPAMK